MVSIKTIAEGLSLQIEAAIEGRANVVQADVLCKSVDSLIRLARLQIDMSAIDWGQSDELPVIQMEKINANTTSASVTPLQPTAIREPLKKSIMQFTGEMLESASLPDIIAEIKKVEVELSHEESEQSQSADGSGDFLKHEKRCKLLRKYLRELRDEVEAR